MDWKSYDTEKPMSTTEDKLAIGIYEWRIPSSVYKDMVVTFLAWTRERQVAFNSVIVPAFGHWDGYRITIPQKTQWREVSNPPKVKPFDYANLQIEGIPEIAPCPFCHATPRLGGRSTSMFGGSLVGSWPYELNEWWFQQCCEWVGNPNFGDPREMVKSRNKLLG